MGISIHAPTRGATFECAFQLLSELFQSTLPREERLTMNTLNTIIFNISIHAPTRGATFFLVPAFWHLVISIHAPTRGATNGTYQYNPLLEHFNPRSHERSDAAYSKRRQHYGNFNPRSHERSDLIAATRTIRGTYFNPRSHERSDSNIAQKICLFLYNTDNKYIIR